MGQIRLSGMAFYAHHGCYPEEQIQGNHFTVDLALEYDMASASDSDALHDALNYAEVYELVKAEMSIRSHLLEHLSARILDRLFKRFPQLNGVEICVAKLNPPVGGPMQSVGVSRKWKRTDLPV